MSAQLDDYHITQFVVKERIVAYNVMMLLLLFQRTVHLHRDSVDDEEYEDEETPVHN